MTSNSCSTWKRGNAHLMPRMPEDQSRNAYICPLSKPISYRDVSGSSRAPSRTCLNRSNSADRSCALRPPSLWGMQELLLGLHEALACHIDPRTCPVLASVSAPPTTPSCCFLINLQVWVVGGLQEHKMRVT